jgi:hypothetical protein
MVWQRELPADFRGFRRAVLTPLGNATFAAFVRPDDPPRTALQSNKEARCGAQS